MNRAHRLAAVSLSLAFAAAGLVLGSAGLAQYAHAAPGSATNSYRSGDFFFPPYPSAADRFGVAGSVSSYTVGLNAGWYQDWSASANPGHPGYLEYARTIYFTVNTNSCGTDKQPASQRSQIAESITGTALIDNLRRNPGALWIIGNEPDSIYDCSPIMPDLYAELFHEFDTFIHAHDPSAQVAIGGIVQPSPLRLAYLDEVLNHYQAAYGQPLPTALWNIHLYAFQEIAGQAGAGVPPGTASSTGWTYNWAQTVDIGVLRQNLRAMRQWMADQGQRNKPLIITEFGQVVPDDGSYTLDGLTFTPQVTRDYLHASTSYFLTATDPLIGDPADGNHLLQLWAWYSLYDTAYGGRLLNPNGSLTLAGQAFGQVAGSAYTPYLDLYPVPEVTPTLALANGQAVTVTVTVHIDNHGDMGNSSPVPARFTRYNAATGQLLATTPVTVTGVLTRYGGLQPQVSASWVITPGSMLTLTFELDPGHTINQARRSPQTLSYLVAYVPDLALTALTGDHGIAFRWTAPLTATFTASVSNGGILTSSTSTVHFRLLAPGGGVVLERTAGVPPLAPGATAQAIAGLPIAAPGVYTVSALITPDAGLDLSAANDMLSVPLFAALHQTFLPILQRSP
jgi:hypothetical protein